MSSPFSAWGNRGLEKSIVPSHPLRGKQHQGFRNTPLGHVYVITVPFLGCGLYRHFKFPDARGSGGEDAGHSRSIEILPLAVPLRKTMSTNDLVYSSAELSKTSG